MDLIQPGNPEDVPKMTPNYLDTLPADVINYVIMPYLEWEERINLNRLMPPGDRAKGRRIPKKDIKDTVRTALAQGRRLRSENLVKFIYTPGRQSHEVVPAVVEFLGGFTRGLYPFLLECEPKLRARCREKVIEFTTAANLAKIESDEMRMNMLEVCTSLGAILNKFKD
jgi:hypothetical protein